MDAQAFRAKIAGLTNEALVAFEEATISPMLRQMAQDEITSRIRRPAWLNRAGKDLTGAVMA